MKPEKIRQAARWFFGILAFFGLLIGIGSWMLLKEKPVEMLSGDYPSDAEKYKPQIDNELAPKPNVILIVADDLGYGDIGAYDNKIIKTPNIDSLAASGLRFTSFYACNSICGPSRAGLLTGRYPFRSGIIGNTYPKNEGLGKLAARRAGVFLKELGVLDIREDYVARGISEQELTLAEGLKIAGYKTGLIGKWHLGDYSSDPRYNPVKHGFDSYLGVPYSNDMRPLPLYRNESEVESDIGNDEDQARFTGLYTKEALRFIEGATEPFFLYLAHTFPHQPLYASDSFKNRSKAGRFGDTVEEIDWSVGRIVDLLRKRKIEENTLVIFTSDNGPWYEGNPGIFRGRKGQSLEGGFRVPFIAKWPARIPSNAVCEAAAINLDLFPTLFELAGLRLPEDRLIDGRNMLGLLTGEDENDTHEAFYFYHYDQLEAVRSGKWKYYRRVNRYTWPIPLDAAKIPNHLAEKQIGDRWPLLYDLELDPGEAYNLRKTHPKVAAQMERRLQWWENANKSNLRGFAGHPMEWVPVDTQIVPYK